MKILKIRLFLITGLLFSFSVRIFPILELPVRTRTQFSLEKVFRSRICDDFLDDMEDTWEPSHEMYESQSDTSGVERALPALDYLNFTIEESHFREVAPGTDLSKLDVNAPMIGIGDKLPKKEWKRVVSTRVDESHSHAQTVSAESQISSLPRRREWSIWRDRLESEYRTDEDGIYKRVLHHLKREDIKADTVQLAQTAKVGEDILIVPRDISASPQELGTYLQSRYESPIGGQWMIFMRKGAWEVDFPKYFKRIASKLLSGALSPYDYSISSLTFTNRKKELRIAIGVEVLVETNRTALIELGYRMKRIMECPLSMQYISYQNFDRFGPQGFSIWLNLSER